MGIVAELFWRQEGVTRSPHPGASFAAIGPLAATICAAHPLAPPHGLESPIGRVYEAGGQVLLLGVGHSENTTLHLAESMAGVPYAVEHPCIVQIDGVAKEVMIAETDHCCRGFAKMDEWLRARGMQREGRVGNAEARLCESRDVVAVAVEQLKREPLVFLCDERAGCEECEAARGSIGT
jgi:aminoglycoside 3-N-acetyltransferase